MAREIRRARYLSEIGSVRELREARVELELREMFARRRLEADIRDTFTFDNLLGMVAPPGSMLDRVIGGVGTGLAAAQGIFGVIGSLLGGIGAKRQAARRPVARTAAKPAVRKPAARKRTPEIEVEVELEKPRTPRTPRTRKK